MQLNEAQQALWDRISEEARKRGLVMCNGMYDDVWGMIITSPEESESEIIGYVLDGWA